MFNGTHRAKIIIVGDPGSGKTSLADRYLNNHFTEEHEMTIGVEYFTQTFNYFWKGQSVKLHLSIWDTAGQEQFQSLTLFYYRYADGAILVFDLTNPDSFQNITKYWINQVRNNCSFQTDEPIILVGNKLESVINTGSADQLRNLAREFATENGLIYLETSAKTGQGVREVFDTMIDRLKLKTEQLKNPPGNRHLGLITIANDSSEPNLELKQKNDRQICCNIL